MGWNNNHTRNYFDEQQVRKVPYRLDGGPLDGEVVHVADDAELYVHQSDAVKKTTGGQPGGFIKHMYLLRRNEARGKYDVAI